MWSKNQMEIFLKNEKIQNSGTLAAGGSRGHLRLLLTNAMNSEGASKYRINLYDLINIDLRNRKKYE